MTHLSDNPRVLRMVDWGLRTAVGFLLWILCVLLAIAFFGTGIDSDELPTWQWTLGVVFIAGEVLIPLGAAFLLSRQLVRRLRRRRMVRI